MMEFMMFKEGYDWNELYMFYMDYIEWDKPNYTVMAIYQL